MVNVTNENTLMVSLDFEYYSIQKSLFQNRIEALSM